MSPKLPSPTSIGLVVNANGSATLKLDFAENPAGANDYLKKATGTSWRGAGKSVAMNFPPDHLESASHDYRTRTFSLRFHDKDVAKQWASGAPGWIRADGSHRVTYTFDMDMEDKGGQNKDEADSVKLPPPRKEARKSPPPRMDPNDATSPLLAPQEGGSSTDNRLMLQMIKLRKQAAGELRALADKRQHQSSHQEPARYSRFQTTPPPAWGSPRTGPPQMPKW